MENRPYDIIVYGASGFTGQYAALEMARVCVGKKLAIAGRNKSKLDETLHFIKQELNEQSFEESDIGVIIADNNNEDTILEMCRQGRVVANCVGPYRWYGELVVRSCVQSSTHYVDISGEPEFLQMCQNLYHNEAIEKGVHIVGACGVDSVPADVGLQLLSEKFPGQLTSAEGYLYLYGSGGGNYGTYNTIIQSVANFSLFSQQRSEIVKPNKLPYVGQKRAHKSIGYNESEQKWFLPFKGADPSVVKRTQQYESSVFSRTPVQFVIYMMFSSFFEVIGVLLFVLNMLILTRFKLGIKLLENYPRFFSFGFFSKRSRLSKDEIENSGFKMMFNGTGYSDEQVSGSTTSEPDQHMSVKFSGPNAGYLFTSSALIAAATTLLDDQLCNNGGVLTPGSAFRNTRFVDRLLKRGVKIEFS